MRICQITPGLIEIPPRTWGAVEKIIWAYVQNAQKQGHTSKWLYLDDVHTSDEWDVVHIHVANLALEAKEKGLNYIFSMHDHHTFAFGKDSHIYKQNLAAIDGSVMSFVPCRFLIPYFNNHPKLHYLEHGVDVDFFKPKIEISDIKKPKLLCLANNGLIGNQGFDRKGFSYAIQAAKILGLEITVVGPTNNRNFFDMYKTEYNNLTILYDVPIEELVSVYQNHDIFIHPSILEAGHPNLTLLEAMACGLPVVGTYEPYGHLNGMYRVERDVNQIVRGIQHITSNYNVYRSKAIETANIYSFENITNKLLKFYNMTIKTKTILPSTKNMEENLLRIYRETTKNNSTPIIIEKQNTFTVNFINGAKISISNDVESSYLVEFIDKSNGSSIYETVIKNNNWAETSVKYYIDWKINVVCLKTNKIVYTHELNLEKNRVYIALESSAIGDTLAWFPMVEEFRKKYKCNLTVSTFHNSFFEKHYPEIQFVKPGDVVHDLYAMYRVGWYYNENNTVNNSLNPTDFKIKPLQHTACDILGLPPMAVKPKVRVVNKEPQILGDYVCIAPHASSHAKYWNYPNGWQVVIDHLNSKGIKVVMLTQEKNGDPIHDAKIGGTLRNVIDKTGNGSLNERITDIVNSKFLIGVGSGLSWLSWALNKPTVLISGFSYPYTEFDCVRIFPKENVCTGCFNNLKLDAGDWNWCPIHKDTTRMFECTKTITPEMVISEIDKLLGEIK